MHVSHFGRWTYFELWSVYWHFVAVWLALEQILRKINWMLIQTGQTAMGVQHILTKVRIRKKCTDQDIHLSYANIHSDSSLWSSMSSKCALLHLSCAESVAYADIVHLALFMFCGTELKHVHYFPCFDWPCFKIWFSWNYRPISFWWY